MGNPSSGGPLSGSPPVQSYLNQHFPVASGLANLVFSSAAPKSANSSVDTAALQQQQDQGQQAGLSQATPQVVPVQQPQMAAAPTPSGSGGGIISTLLKVLAA